MIIDIIISVQIFIALAAWLFANGYVAGAYTTEMMREVFINDRGALSKIGANSFYAIAWALKGIKFLVNKWIA